MIRIFDIFFSSLGLFFLSPVLVIIFIIGWLENGDPIFKQERVGLYKKPFFIFKFRTMKLDTDILATHLIDSSAVTDFGRILRKNKLDELPQLWNVLLGEMSIVGPRPCLFNQTKLINERDFNNVFNVPPGITGLSQLEGIDMSRPKLLAKTDAKMIKNLNFINYFRYIFLTILGQGSGDKVKTETFKKR
jgi:O-antigen biosynthesis protein WbqP